MGDVNSNTENQKKAKGLHTGTINLLVTLVVVLIPLGMYLLYMEKQEGYFKAYYHRNLGNIAQIMDTRLSSLNYPWYNLIQNTRSLPPWGTSLGLSEEEGVDEGDKDKFLRAAILAQLDMQANKFTLKKNVNNKIMKYSATLLVDNLISEQDNASLFEMLLLTDINGNVYYEPRNVFPQLHRLTPEEKQSFFSPDKVKSKGSEDVAIYSTFTTSTAGNNYNVFCQALSASFYIDTNTEKNRLFLCGLVKSQHFQFKVKAISANKVVIAISMLIIAFLLTPFLKLWFICPNEPYRRIDQIVLRISFFFLIAIITIGLLDYLRYSRLNDRLDSSMGTIALHMANAFKNELGEAVNDLNAYDQCKIINNADYDCEKYTDKIEPYNDLLKQLTSYPPFELIGAVRSSGKTLPGMEVTARNKKTVVGDISKRAYFQNALNGPRWSGAVCAPLAKGCTIDRITSMNEGVKMTAIAALSAADHDLSADQPKINAMFKRFRTFISPPLPSSFKFAVVQNTDGQVLFHSDDRFSLVENFFLEIELDTELMEAIRNLTPQTSEKADPQSKIYIPYGGRYHGKDHRFVLIPLIIPDWTLVVLRDMSRVQTINAEVIYNSIACIFLFFSVLVILMVAAKLLYERHVGGWNWPSLQYRERYIPVIGMFAIIAVIMGWQIYNDLFGKQLFVFFILSSALAMSTVLALLMPGRYYQRKSIQNIIRCSLPLLIYASLLWYLNEFPESFSYPMPLIFLGFLWLIFYLAALYCFVWKNKNSVIPSSWIVNLHILFSLFYFTILSILPAWAAFEDTWHNNLEAYARSNLIEFSYSLEKMQQALRKDARRIRSQSEIKNEDIDSCVYSLIYMNRNAEECNKKAIYKETSHKYLSRYFTDLLPNLNLLSARLRTFQSAHGVEQGKGKPAQNWFWAEGSYRLKKYNTNIVGDSNISHIKLQKVNPTTYYVSPSELHVSLSELPISIATSGEGNIEVKKVNSDNYILLLTIVFFWFISLWFVFRMIGNRIFAFDNLVIPTRLQIVSFDKLDAWEWWVNSRINRFIIRPQENVGEKLKKLGEIKDKARAVAIINLSCEDDKSDNLFRQWITEASQLSGAVIILDNFESHIYEIEYSSIKLKLLTRLLQDKDNVIHIISQIDIPDCLQAFFQGRKTDSQASSEDVRQWIKILKKFQKAHLDNYSNSWRDIDNEPEAILERESEWTNKLSTLKENLKNNMASYDWKENDIVSIFSDQADLFYREQWLLCNEEEKRTLYHLALGHQFNPKNAIVMQCLSRRRLVRRDPEFKVVSESLRRFILHAESSDRVIVWNKESKEGIWPALKVPFIGLLVITTGILFFSQPETFHALAGFLAAFTAASPILFRMFALSASEK